MILNSVVGISYESSAEKAIATIQEYPASKVEVIRNGNSFQIWAEKLLPYDIDGEAVGDGIPAVTPYDCYH